MQGLLPQFPWKVPAILPGAECSEIFRSPCICVRHGFRWTKLKHCKSANVRMLLIPRGNIRKQFNDHTATCGQARSSKCWPKQSTSHSMDRKKIADSKHLCDCRWQCRGKPSGSSLTRSNVHYNCAFGMSNESTVCLVPSCLHGLS